MNNLQLWKDVHKMYYVDNAPWKDIKIKHKLQSNQLKAILKERHPILAQITNLKAYRQAQNKRKWRIREGLDERRPGKAERRAIRDEY